MTVGGVVEVVVSSTLSAHTAQPFVVYSPPLPDAYTAPRRPTLINNTRSKGSINRLKRRGRRNEKREKQNEKTRQPLSSGREVRAESE